VHSRRHVYNTLGATEGLAWRGRIVAQDLCNGRTTCPTSVQAQRGCL